ncbi:MAG TPA: hypothetical protein VNA25_19895 [Phycisphaerae bacterium]|nr:hypothetical protein [Phycisphaerae bacterium]
MDKATAIKWIVGIVVRGIAWVLAARLGFAAAESASYAEGIGQALGALALVGVSMYTSVKGRKKLKAEVPK